MRIRKYSDLFRKKIKKLKGQEARNFIKKRDEVLNSTDLNHYKNLRKPLNRYKRIHINDSFVILFFGDDGVVYFVDYEHHDKIYKGNKIQIEKYENLKFS